MTSFQTTQIGCQNYAFFLKSLCIIRLITSSRILPKIKKIRPIAICIQNLSFWGKKSPVLLVFCLEIVVNEKSKIRSQVLGVPWDVIQHSLKTRTIHSSKYFFTLPFDSLTRTGLQFRLNHVCFTLFFLKAKLPTEENGSKLGV